MTVKNLFIFDAIVCLVFGLPFIFIPQDLAKLFLTDPALTDGAITTFCNYGIMLSCAAIGLLLARNAMPSTARKGLLIFIATAGTLTSINLIYAVLSGIENCKGWLGIIPTIIICIWEFGFYRKKK